MKAEVKKKWVDALRSGKFSQGRDWLKRKTGENTKYCCLGVLCEVLELKSDIHTHYDEGAGDTYYLFKTPAMDTDVPCCGDNDCEYAEEATSTIPKDLRESLEMRSSDVSILIRMNDDEERSFEEIAKWVDENL